MAQQLWTRDEVIYRLAEAVDTLDRLPWPKDGGPSCRMTAWPDVVRQTIDAYGRTPIGNRPAAPSPEAIARLDATLQWLFWLEYQQRQIVWARALDVTWRRLEERIDLSHVTLRARYRSALDLIVATLNKNSSSQPLHAFEKSA